MKLTSDIVGRSHEREKAGSALLVVLGFLSFMVVSAVAFAIYMRAERVPSSALRRNVATRHLVKAALAHAMSRVDDAIRADPFPGLPNTNNNSTADCYHDNKGNAMDVWYGRVFMPPDPEGSTDPYQDVVDGISATRFAPITETVSVLNLEALGYIPPPLVNDVRFLSRSTWTAKWQNFLYDAGRFAFCAVNVSDYFDINRVTAGVRTSAPDSRISLAYLMRSDDKKMDSISQGALTTFQDNFGQDAQSRQSYSNGDGNGGSVDATVPYVSMLDYNLALGSKFSSGLNGLIRSMFYWWIDEGKRYFYANGAAASDLGVRQAARQPFVADSWNADMAIGTVSAATNYLQGANATPDSQPFSATIMRRTHDKVTMLDVYQDISRSGKWDSKNNQRLKLHPVDQIALFDYLDGNDYPMSLAFPCVERVPMVASLGLRNLTVNLNLTPTGPATPSPGATPNEQYLVTEFKLDGEIIGGAVESLLAFPFLKGHDFKKSGYTVQAMVRVILAQAGFNKLRMPTKEIRPIARDWDAQTPPAFKTEGGLANAFVITATSVESPITLPTVTDERSMLITAPFTFSGINSQEIVFRSRVKQVNHGTAAAPVWTTSGAPQFNLPIDVFDANGSLMGLPARGDGGWIEKAELDGLGEFVPYVCVWVRVMKGDDAVDYVPANLDDDQEQLGKNTRSDAVANDVIGADGGMGIGVPLLKWVANGNPFKFVDTPAPYSCGDWLPKSYNAVDPRYNWAPEDWVQDANNDVNQTKWLDLVDSVLGKDGRDSDPFLFVSNLGYLQSIGEFAFLPRLSGLDEVQLLAKGYDGEPRAGADNIANKACVWTCFRPYAMEGGDSDQLFRRGVSSGEGSVAVNPYTDDENVMLAAFANTPYDWWAAGTNSNSGSVGSDAEKTYFSAKSYVKSDDVKKSLDYAFTDGNSKAKLKGEDVAKIARVICESIRSQPQMSWENVYDSLDWYGLNSADDNDFLGVRLDSPLYGVDRKFLYAYWRDCLANKQQLFLIFVRAESTALGGPGEGTPSQQGGRAVALVWREPQSNTVQGSSRNGAQDDQRRTYVETSGRRRPHRMRVLFYHQFD